VFLFEDAGAMNDEAANALLKTLEEPTATTIFILIAESEDDLPATVASRSRTVLFGRVSEDEIVAALTAQGIAEDQAHRVAVAAGGRPGLALLLATSPAVAAFRTAWLSVPARLTSQPGDAIRLAEAMVAAADPLLRSGSARARLAAAEEISRTAAYKDRHERNAAGGGGSASLRSGDPRPLVSRAASLVRRAAQPDVPTELAGVRCDVVARARRHAPVIPRSQRPELAFSALFADLGASA
jgi:DNA polymerase-3 subunit delta'